MTRFARAPNRTGTDSHKWGKYAGADIIPAWVADTDFPAAPAILAALRARLRHGVFGYADIPPQLTANICDYFWRRWRWRVQPPWLVFLPGLGAAIHIVCRMAEGGGILTPSPIYHVFRRAPAIANAQRRDAKMVLDAGGVWRMPLENLQAAATADTRVFQLCNPHNPNGKIYERDELLSIAEFCEQRDIIICADEVHADLILEQGREHLPLAALDENIAKRTITLQSPSKAFNIAGLNFAVAVVPDENLRARFNKAASGKVITHLNPFGLSSATAAWSGECDQWLQESNTHLRNNRDILSAATKKIPGITMPHLESTYLAWLNISALNLQDAPQYFQSHGIGMSPGADFGDADYMRLNFGCTAKVLREIIRRLKKAASAAA